MGEEVCRAEEGRKQGGLLEQAWRWGRRLARTETEPWEGEDTGVRGGGEDQVRGSGHIFSLEAHWPPLLMSPIRAEGCLQEEKAGESVEEESWTGAFS